MIGNTQYKFQLSNDYKTQKELLYECKHIIEQIEEYEGRGKGYRIREVNRKWAIYTKGNLAKRQLYIRKDDNIEKVKELGSVSLGELQGILQEAKRGLK